MFISTKYLVSQYGIDEAIARFFVDREPPANNLYWHEKLLYLRPSPGYLFIPLIVDLLYKLGLNKERLLSLEFITSMEGIGHISAMEETSAISRNMAIEKSEGLVKERCANPLWLSIVQDYFKSGENDLLKRKAMPFKSLHRGDAFLYSLVTIDFPKNYFENIAEQWFSLIGVLLLLDDADDIDIDKTAGEENAFLEKGLNAKSLVQIAAIVQHGLEKISTLNPIMSRTLERQYIAAMQMPHIAKHLNPSA